MGLYTVKDIGIAVHHLLILIQMEFCVLIECCMGCCSASQLSVRLLLAWPTSLTFPFQRQQLPNDIELKGPLQQDDLKEHLSHFVLGLSCWTEKMLNCKKI